MINLDRDQRNADWIKTLSWEYPTDAEQFLHFIGGPENLAHFMTLPVAEQMPPSLRAELSEIGSGSKADFTPSLHPRDEHGRFISTPGFDDPVSLEDEATGNRQETAGFYVGETVSVFPSVPGRIVRLDNVGAHVEVQTPRGPQVQIVPMDNFGPQHEHTIAHAIIVESNDDSGRTYMVTYYKALDALLTLQGHSDQKQELLDTATRQLKSMIAQNHQFEEDLGIKNAWNGEVHLGLGEERERGAVGTKDWNCTISFDINYMLRVAEGEMDSSEFARIHHLAVSSDEASMIYRHELAHGLSNTVTEDSGQTPSISYRAFPAFEEGVVQGYVEAKSQVDLFGPDSPTVLDDFSTNRAPGSGAYSSWVDGLDEAALMSVYPTRADRLSARRRITVGERLEFYRSLMLTPLARRDVTVDREIANSGYELDLTGRGLGTNMGYSFHSTTGVTLERELAGERVGKAAKRTDIHTLIYRVESPEDARRLLPKVAAYLENDPDDYLEVARDAEALVMLATADQPAGSKAFDPHLHPRDSEGRFAETPGVAIDVGEADLATTTEEVEAAFDRGTENFYRAIERVGSGLKPEDQYTAKQEYGLKNIDLAEPEAVPENQRERCERDAAMWLADEQMQRDFTAYGKPEVVVASRLVGEDKYAGTDPFKTAVAGQWVNGTIFLYGDTAGEPEKIPGTPGYTIGGNDNQATLTHEYGHQIMRVVAFDRTGGLSTFMLAWLAALGGEDTTSTGGVSFEFQTPSGLARLKRQSKKISGYAAKGGPGECFAEAYALIRQPDFDITNYTDGVRNALQLLNDKIGEDTDRARSTIEL